tara:strand:- start:42 stop:401 length:360 start_codon:yes stop_codon:yes gene_type:complete
LCFRPNETNGTITSNVKGVAGYSLVTTASEGVQHLRDFARFSLLLGRGLFHATTGGLAYHLTDRTSFLGNGFVHATTGGLAYHLTDRTHFLHTLLGFRMHSLANGATRGFANHGKTVMD